MPIYEYVCCKCKYTIQQIMKFIDTLPECPECRIKMVRKIGVPVIRFVGSGFHCNDYSKKGKKKT